MSKATIRISHCRGRPLFVPAFVIPPALGVVLAIVVFGAGYVAMQTIGKSQMKMKNFEGSDLLGRMWIPVRDELSEVVRMGGRVTAASSEWTGVPNLYKQSTPTRFIREWSDTSSAGEVAALVASASTMEENRQQRRSSSRTSCS